MYRPLEGKPFEGSPRTKSNVELPLMR